MTLADSVRTVRWMVRDTFRQSLSTRLFWVTLAVTGMCTLFCASVRVSGDPLPVTTTSDIPAVLPKTEVERIGMEKARNDGVRVISGEMTIGFGAISVPVGRSRDDSVKFLHVWLAGGLGDTIGVLLALLWTAGFLPTFLEPQSATVLLAKPASRWSILVGKYFGVVGFVALQAIVFVVATWTALGVATGVWTPAYLLAAPLLVMNFGVFFAVSTFFAVWTRSTVATAFGTLLFWLLCWAVNFTHHRLTMAPVEGMSPHASWLLDISYWVFPKPLDLSGIFFDAMQADGFASKVGELQSLQQAGKYSAEAAIGSSAVFAAGMLGFAAYEFEMTDF